jgi:Heparinase II/III-like protein/Heparinase II/III N-terminus
MATDSIFPGRVKRLIAMDRAEMVERLRQFCLARFDFFRHSRRHDLRKITDGASADDAGGHFFFHPEELRAIRSLIRGEFPAQSEEIISRADKIRAHQFDLLGYENLDYGVDIDWHLDVVHGKRAPNLPWYKIRYLDFQQVGDAKITWELNRHQHFVTLAKAYLLTGDQAFASEVISQWEQWWKQNPYPIGLNWASSLEVAFRAQSWIWTFFLLRGCPLFTQEQRRRWIAGLRVSGRHIANYLSTYFSPNTHLLGEALALFCLGTLFSFPSSQEWREKGWAILVREAATQVREDGFYFEQSIYYHVYASDIFLHARILAQLNRIAVPDEFEKNLLRMLDALLLLGGGGVPHMFGDDDGGRLFDGKRNRAIHMLDPLATGAVLYRRLDFKSVVETLPEETLWLCGVKSAAEFEGIAVEESRPASGALPASGLYLIADSALKQQLLIRAGQKMANSGGHAHADALSVSLIRDGRVLLRDSGTFEYVGPGNERSRLRGTGAHSTLRVDGRDQAEMTGPFSWASLPPVRVDRWINGKTFGLFEGSHGGYSLPQSSIIHRRFIFHPLADLWFVRDVVEGDGEHELEIAWHIGAGLAPDLAAGALFSEGGLRLAVLTEEGSGWSRIVRDFGSSPVYGKTEPACVVSFVGRQALPAEFVTVLMTHGVARGSYGRIERIIDSQSGVVSVHRYLDDRHDCTFIFARENSTWSHGAWISDAEFLYASIDHASDTRHLVLCDAAYLDAGGNRLLSCGRRVSYAEVSSGTETSHICSSDPDVVRLEQPLSLLWPEEAAVAAKNEQRKS